MAKLVLLIEPDPWYKVFFRNLADVFLPRRESSFYVSSPPGEFWPDVFVHRPLPWQKLLESAAYHVLLIALLVALHRYLPHVPVVTAQSVFSHSDVIYYEPSEYLPPLNTGGIRPEIAQKGDPVYAPQPIISVPSNPDNQRQTIVTPPDVKLQHDVDLPNIVAWGEASKPMVPMAAIERSADPRRPTLPTDLIAPAPEVNQVNSRAGLGLAQQVVAPTPQVDLALSRKRLSGPQGEAVAPAPVVQSTLTRRAGNINIGHATVVAPAPQLAMEEQHTARAGNPALGGARSAAIVPPPPSLAGVSRSGRSGTGTGTSATGSASVIPPPPTIAGSGGVKGGGRLIALGIHPAAPTASVQVPTGNRRGSFAAGPQGRTGGTGTPNITGGGSGNGGGNGGHSGDVPAGIFVGAGQTQSLASGQGSGSGAGGTKDSSNPVLSAKNDPPRVGSTKAASTLDNPSPLERKVFGDRRSYSMTLNMPNLNSAGGSWVIHFAELSATSRPGELLPPVATKKVDPGYPLELIRRNIQGTVTIRAVIHSDGSVSDIKVLQGVNDQLDQFACEAFSRWKFIPAEKNGAKVALDAVVMIPFRTGRLKSSF